MNKYAEALHLVREKEPLVQCITNFVTVNDCANIILAAGGSPSMAHDVREAAEAAKRYGMDYFTTTLSISPLKNAAKLNEIGASLEAEYGVRYLYSDFKKKNGYKRSVELSEQYGMYRQYYCGCVFSKNQRDREIAAKEQAASGMQTEE